MAKKHPGKKSDTRTGTQSPIDLGLLEQITRMMRDNDLNTIEVRDGDKRVILKRGAPVASGNSGFVAFQAPMAAQQASVNSAASSGAASAPAVTDVDAGLVQIKSPMVGTFYSSPSPDAKPFVSVGSTIDEDTDVCVIEAMKVFNNIKAEMNGTISKILVTNGQTVEFGQPLFLVKPA